MPENVPDMIIATVKAEDPDTVKEVSSKLVVFMVEKYLHTEKSVECK